MAKDYFSDLSTNDEPKPRRVRIPEENAPATPERSIRNIPMPIRRQSVAPKVGASDIRPEVSAPAPIKNFSAEPPRKRSRLLMWAIAAIALVALAGAAFLLFWSDTTVTVTPRTHQVAFDPSTQFTAYPQGTAPDGGIVYTVQMSTFEDSETVPATGTEKAEDRASGTITVYNEYSPTTVRLIKNTRFEGPNGLIFRIPASVEVPGMTAGAPGQITITVFADQPGPDYNIAPTERFTLPGLKNTKDMYAKVYARSSAPFSGGFIGEKPAVSPQALDAARSEIRSRLAERARIAAASVEGGFAFPGLVRIAYESLPITPDPAGGARVNEKATIQVPVFPSQNFAHAVARAVSADASDSPVSLRPQGGFAGTPVGDGPDVLGEAPLVFTLEGSATVVWDVDMSAIAGALAGRDQNAFETIIAGFPGVEKAQANIAPFWSSTFPASPSDIKIEVEEPTS